MPVLVTLSLSAALLCFNGSCHRALVGDTTPTGTYPLTPQPTAQPGYRGDVLLFRADPDGWFAVHRTWPGREKMYRWTDARRRHISHGCVNIEPDVYESLWTQVRTDGGTLVIE